MTVHAWCVCCSLLFHPTFVPQVPHGFAEIPTSFAASRYQMVGATKNTHLVGSSGAIRRKQSQARCIARSLSNTHCSILIVPSRFRISVNISDISHGTWSSSITLSAPCANEIGEKRHVWHVCVKQRVKLSRAQPVLLGRNSPLQPKQTPVDQPPSWKATKIGRPAQKVATV